MNKKLGFSYLELIISMGLVVMVVFLTTPFLTHMEKNTSAKYGEYRAYAKYICSSKAQQDFPGFAWQSKLDCDWILFQNTRRSLPEYDPNEEKPCPYDSNGIQICGFILPNHVTSYKVQIYGAGGEGSEPYYYDNLSGDLDILNVSRGMGGKSKNPYTAIDTLARAVSDNDDSIVKIYRCVDVFMEGNFKYITKTAKNGDLPKNCIGIGEQNAGGESAAKIYSDEKRSDIKKRFLMGKFNETNLADARLFFANNLLIKNLTEYMALRKNTDSESVEKVENLFLYLTSPSFPWESSSDPELKPQNLYSIGHSGGDTFFRYDASNDPIIAHGGEGGRTYTNTTQQYNINNIPSTDEIDLSTTDFYKQDSTYIVTGAQGDFSNAGAGGSGGNCFDSNISYDEAYCYGNSPIVMACSKNDKEAACENNSQRVFHYGAGGGGGALKATSTGSSYEYQRFSGAAGAGGAVIIQWN